MVFWMPATCTRAGHLNLNPSGFCLVHARKSPWSQLVSCPRVVVCVAIRCDNHCNSAQTGPVPTSSSLRFLWLSHKSGPYPVAQGSIAALNRAATRPGRRVYRDNKPAYSGGAAWLRNGDSDSCLSDSDRRDPSTNRTSIVERNIQSFVRGSVADELGVRCCR